MDDNQFGVPAGWYPDPLGLPQLRWWDAQAWTEYTSEARAPIVIQPATRATPVDDAATAYADDAAYADESIPAYAADAAFNFTADTGFAYGDEDRSHVAEADLPSRRDIRETERHDDSSLLDHDTLISTDRFGEELSAQPLLAMTLRELEPPISDGWEGEAPGPRSASSHANAAPAESTLSAMAEEIAPERAPKRMRTYTFASWAIALMPLFQLAIAMAFLLVFNLSSNYPLVILMAVLASLAIIGFAFYDRLLLTMWGHKKPASALWSLLREPPYLIARALRTFGETGKGFAPFAVWSASLGLILAAVLAFPGLVISLAPGVFQDEAQQSIQADAAALGADITVACPAPPVLIGSLFTCIRTGKDGVTDSVAVSLQRENGWISWRVEDWGNAVMFGSSN